MTMSIQPETAQKTVATEQATFENTMLLRQLFITCRHNQAMQYNEEMRCYG